jgi:predicted amidohydrolase
VDPTGETVADAGGKEQAILAEVDPTLVARTRAEFPFLADRRA